MVAIVYTEKIPPNQIKLEYLAVNCNKVLINFTSRVKNFHNVDLRGGSKDLTGKWKEIGKD